MVVFFVFYILEMGEIWLRGVVKAFLECTKLDNHVLS